MKIHFMSDPHYGHKNICRGTSSWEEKQETGQRTRDFNTVEEMNDAIVKGINDNVAENDILYCLGDWSFGGIQNIWEFRKRINCKNIHLILGNHDHHIENNRKINIHVDDLTELYNIIGPQLYNEYVVDGETAEEEFDKDDCYYKIPVRYLFSSVNHMLVKEIGGVKMTLCHYAFRTWDKAHHGTWMLYGHSHGTLPEYICERESFVYMKDIYFKTTDVGIDVAFKLYGVYRPFSLDNDLKPMMKDRIPLLVDHHNPKTN